MKRDCFTLILRFLHLNDNSLYRKKGEPGHDPLYKLRPFIHPLISNFQQNYIFSQEVSIDETMIGYKFYPIPATKWGLNLAMCWLMHTQGTCITGTYTQVCTFTVCIYIHTQSCMSVSGISAYVHVRRANDQSS